MTLQEKMNQYKQGMRAKAPAEVLAVMDRATADLKNSGIMDRAVRVGAKAPEFVLNNAQGQPISLRCLLAKGNVVLAFYRGKW